MAARSSNLSYYNAADGKLLQSVAVPARYLYAVDAAADGGLVAAGLYYHSKQSGGRAQYVVRMGADRKPAWSATFDSLGVDPHPHGLAVQADGRIVLGATVNSVGSGTQVRLLTMSAHGDKLSEVSVGTTANEYAYDLALLSDGRPVVVGQAGDGTASNGYMVTFSAWGHDQCVKAGLCADLAVAKCVDNNPCTLDSCDPAKGCTNTPVKDGLACGSGKTCKAGACG